MRDTRDARSLVGDFAVGDRIELDGVAHVVIEAFEGSALAVPEGDEAEVPT